MEGAEPLQSLERLFGIAGAPAPFLVDHPKRDMGEEDDRDAILEPGHILFQPLQLFLAD